MKKHEKAIWWRCRGCTEEILVLDARDREAFDKAVRAAEERAKAHAKTCPRHRGKRGVSPGPQIPVYIDEPS